MTIELTQKKIPVRDLVENYENRKHEGVTGYDGKLDIRPPYQREFIYKLDRQQKVIETIKRGLHLNTIYWADNGNENYEVLDGQQRIMSICQYVNNKFSIKDNGIMKKFHNLPSQIQKTILDHELLVFLCKGSDDDKLEWFDTINTGGIKLSDQEILNAIFVGPFVMEAKKYFSRKNEGADVKGSDYLESSGDNQLDRQGFLHTALKWIVNAKGLKSVDEYMNDQRQELDADELKNYFIEVIDWVKARFPTYRPKYMKRTDWGKIYEDNKHTTFNEQELEDKIKELLKSEEVEKPKEIWPFVLYSYGKDERGFLNMLTKRFFSEEDKLRKYEEQNGICWGCKGYFEFEKMHGDHNKSWISGGPTVYDNLVMLCERCNLRKGGK